MQSDPTAFEIDFDPTARRMRGRAVHGNTPFDVPFISEVAPNLWQGGCETGLVLPTFIRHVVSLYPWERYTVRGLIDTELYVKMYDSRGMPDTEQIVTLAKWVNECRSRGNTLVHCQAGLNRSSLVAATALMLEGQPGDEVLETIRSKRSPACLCNPDFEAFVRGFADGFAA